MSEFTLKTRNGETHSITGRSGVSLMENIRDAGFEELVAMCGGCLSCATCHVYISDLPAAAALPPQEGDEDGLLDGSDFREAGSRLSCQIPFHDGLAGITVTVAPPD